MPAVVVRAARFLNDGNARPLGQTPHRADKIEMLVFHDEAKNRAPRAAAKTMIRLPLRVNMERGALLAVERTQRDPACARALERKVRADHLDDVVGFGDALDGFFGKAGHGDKIPCGSNPGEGDSRGEKRFSSGHHRAAGSLTKGGW